MGGPGGPGGRAGAAGLEGGWGIAPGRRTEGTSTAGVSTLSVSHSLPKSLPGRAGNGLPGPGAGR